jgi:hypothetical protein
MVLSPSASPIVITLHLRLHQHRLLCILLRGSNLLFRCWDTVAHRYT